MRVDTSACRTLSRETPALISAFIIALTADIETAGPKAVDDLEFGRVLRQSRCAYRKSIPSR
jgi:hypothetical protein